VAGQRPGGVVLIAVLAWIGAVTRILLGSLVVAHVLSPAGSSVEAGWVAIVVGVISFLVAFYLFSGSPLARVLVTISFAISILSSVFSIAARPSEFAGPTITGILAVIGLILLYTRRANQYFR
jgi:hypothetical protein